MKKKSTKKILCALLLTGIASTAQQVMAAEAYDTSPFCGFYVGGGAGGSFSSAKERNSIHSTSNINTPFILPNQGLPFLNTTNNTFDHSSAHAHRKSRMAAGLYAGYGYVWGNCSYYYMGLETFLNYSGYKTKSRNNLPFHSNSVNIFITTSTDATEIISNKNKLQRWEGGADLRPGVFLTPCALLYARIGVGYNRWSIHSRLNALLTQKITFNQFQAQGVSTSLASAANRNKNKKTGTLRLGMGLEQNLCENITIRADYVSTSYRSIKVKHTYPMTDGNGNTATFTNTNKISSMFNNSVMLGMSYYW